MIWIPTAAEERLMAVGAPTPWKSFSLLPRIGFFILTSICAAALAGFLAVVGGGRLGLVFGGVVAVVAAELLIRPLRFFASGLEEALWFVGATEIVCSVTDWNLFALGVASIIGAIRLLNPLFAVLGVVLIAFRFHPSEWVYCSAVASVALVLLPIPVRRPSIDRTLGAFAVVMPLAAYLFAKDGQFAFDPRVVAALLIYAAVALILGLRFRLHAPLIALFPTLGCFAYEVRELSGMSLEARLIVWGSVLLGVAIAIERFLKTPRNGFTSRQLGDDNLGDLLQLAGTVAIAPHHQKPAEQGGPQVATGDGSSFGGGGAGGDFQ